MAKPHKPRVIHLIMELKQFIPLLLFTVIGVVWGGYHTINGAMLTYGYYFS